MAVRGVRTVNHVLPVPGLVQTANEIYCRAPARQNEDKLDRYGNTLTIPIAVCASSGRILWTNPAFYILTGSQGAGFNLFRILPELSRPNENNSITIKGRVYRKETIWAKYQGKDYVIYRLIEAEHIYAAGDMRHLSSPCVCQVQIDNYDDVIRGIPQSRQAELRTAIENLVSRHAERIHALYERYDRDKYIVVFERRKLADLIQHKFDILAQVRAIDTGIMGVYPTLSLGVGVGTFRTPPTPTPSGLWRWPFRAEETRLC